MSAIEENGLTLNDLFRIIRTNWYWFVLSVAMCLGIAVLYILYNPDVYMGTASVLIVNEKGGAAIESQAFDEINTANMKSNIDNELSVLKSKRLIEEVVKRLNLQISYKVKNGIFDHELYRKSPINIQFLDSIETEYLSVIAKFSTDNKVSLSGFVNEKEWRMKGLFNDTIHTPIGNIIAIPTRFFTSEYYNLPLRITKKTMRQVILETSNNLQTILNTKSGTIINLTMMDESPERAEDILNTLIEVYNEYAIKEKNRIAINTSNFINERLAIIEEELSSVDTDIEIYKKENRLTDIHSETGMYLKTTSLFQQQELDLENQLAIATYIKEYLNDNSKQSDLIPSNTGISDNYIEKQINVYNNLLLKRDKLINNSSDNNPVIMDMNHSLEAMWQSILTTVDNLIKGISVKIKNTNKQEEQNINRISAVPTQQKYVLTVERQQKIKEQLYLYLLNKREENELSMNIQENYARIVDPAYGSDAPVAPKTNIILLASFILGIIIPGGAIWIRISMDTRIHTQKEVEEQISAPFLGEIPFCSTKKEKVIYENETSAVCEAFRFIRTKLDILRMKLNSAKVIMFTSFDAGEGKTFVSSNLAKCIAMTGKKVILLDLDVRKATLSVNRKKSMSGIIAYLSGKTDSIDSIIQKGEFDSSLDIIYCDTLPPNPADILLSDKLDILIEELKKRYDYVIIDNVPSVMFADAVIVNRLTDLTIYVIRAKTMDRCLLPEIEKQYKEETFTNMAVLLNGTCTNSTFYKYYRYNYSKLYSSVQSVS